MAATTERAILAGGCFWGMQQLIRRRPGIVSTRVGYSGGDVPNATYRNHGTHAEAIDFARESDRDIVSVRYSGLIREEAGRDATAFDEIWHLVREHARSDGSWLIAGIQQSH